MNRSIMYWKWDNDVLDSAVMDKKVRDLTTRTKIGNICVGTQWIKEHFHDETIGKAFSLCIERLHEAGRKAIIECCIRNEGEPFYQKYPGEPAYLLSFYEGVADDNGCGSFVVPHEQVWHYWRRSGENGEHKLFSAYALDKDGAYVKAAALDNVHTQALKKGNGYEIAVTFRGAKAGQTVAVCIGFPQPIVDLAHPMLIPYFKDMVRHALELGADGVFSDEWGYDMILKIVQPNPYDDTELNLRHVSYSVWFEEKYRETTGEPLFENLLSLFYAVDKGTRRKDVINGYLKTLRLLCTENEGQMYDAVKEIMGQDAFWGVHPTWWGSVDSLNFEFLKNGFYWWDAKRDYAQTDEMILYSIRTALAHRFSSPVWYNMWYSMGTRDINTYYEETWRNLRYGGRTHYLGYECPNEAVVLELKPQGMLESIEEMDARVRMFDGVVSQPDCRLLILFGYESVSNWADIGMEIPFLPQNPRLDRVLNTTNELFQSILCDLVPSYAVENGTLFLNRKGKAQYGTQEYDAVIALYPEGTSSVVKEFLFGLSGSKFAACGDHKEERAARLYCEFAKYGATIYDGIPPADELVRFAEQAGVLSHYLNNGCIMQDGSVIFTGDGKLPIGNDLRVSALFNGKRIEFTGKDALYLSADGETAIYPEGELTVDGKKILSAEVIK